MSKLNVINIGSNSYYNYSDLVRKVYHRTSDKKELGLLDTIEIIDCEPSKRVYLKSGEKYFWIRYFINHTTPKYWNCNWTLYTEDENGESYQVSWGESTIKYINEE